MTSNAHVFNLLDARHAISVTERQRYILRVRDLSRAVAEAYLRSRAEPGFPLADTDTRKVFEQEVIADA